MPTLVFVHSVNPYGFAKSRRTNENNIDINRNFLSDEEFVMALKRDPNIAGYTDLDPLLNPTVFPTSNILLNDIQFIAKGIYTLLLKGFRKLKTTIVAGNYHKSDGIGFGGFERSSSVNHVLSLLDERKLLFDRTSKLVFVDVHTGLGPEGVDTFLFGNVSQRHIDKAREIFPFENNTSGSYVCVCYPIICHCGIISKVYVM
jgi:hypothetical protein